MRSRHFNTLVALIVTLAGFGVFVRFWGDASANAAGRLIFGWISFLFGVLSRVQVNWNAVATAAICLLLIFAISHRFLRWLWSARHETNETPARPWQKRWTALLVGAVVLMFITGVAFVGVVHQLGWMAASRDKLTTYQLRLGEFYSSPKNLNQIGGGAHNYRETFKTFPVNGIDERQGANHSWQTRLLAFGLWYNTEGIHFDVDWNDPRNIEAFQRFVPEYLNPDIGELRDAQGFAVSHYAGNVRVFDRNKPLTESDVIDGTSQTILAGECASDFKAWGDPTNLRDPAGGINQIRDGFGGPKGTGACFAMLDGSVRFISSDIDPLALAALATPDGGDAPRPDWKRHTRQMTWAD